jgi:hypothetical protein
MDYGLNDQCSLPGRGSDGTFFLLPLRVQTGSGAHPTSYPMDTGSEADCASPSSAEVKNVWSYTSTLSICLHGMVHS